jgi:hypothetical protein
MIKISLFQVDTFSDPQPIEHNHLGTLTSQRNERAVLRNNNNNAAGAASVEAVEDNSEDEDSFIARVRRLDCRQDVEKLIIDILESPPRQKNALLVNSCNCLPLFFNLGSEEP